MCACAWGCALEPAPPPEGWVLGDVQACEAGAETPTWVDRAEERGLGTAPDPDGVHTSGGGAAVADFDGDGDLDLAIHYAGASSVYLRDGQGYTRLEVAGDDAPRWTTAVDSDQDGIPEFVRAGTPPSKIAIVDGAAQTSPLVADPDEAPAWPAQGLYPGDLDGDGITDLIALRSNAAEPDYLLRGQGDGSFEPDLEALPESARGGLGFDARWFDHDDDGDLDVYVANDLGAEFGANVLLVNEGGALFDASADCACGLATEAMGVSVGDMDQDARPDLYVTESAGAALLLHQSDGTYADADAAYAVPLPGIGEMGWGAALADVDNDADLDIVEARGDLWDLEHGTAAPDRPALLRNDGGAFVDATAGTAMDVDGAWRVVIPFAANDDGVLDWLITDVVGRPLLLESTGCTAPAWLELEVPAGTRVEVQLAGRTQVDWATHQVGMSAYAPSVVHLGLGADDEVLGVDLRLPDGTLARLDGPLEARRRLQWQGGTGG